MGVSHSKRKKMSDNEKAWLNQPELAACAAADEDAAKAAAAKEAEAEAAAAEADAAAAEEERRREKYGYLLVIGHGLLSRIVYIPPLSLRGS